MSTDWYAPNQQAVRGDQSGPGEQGEGGTAPVEVETVAELTGLDAMTKDELLDRAVQMGVSPANKNMTKEELKAAIEEHEQQQAGAA